MAELTKLNSTLQESVLTLLAHDNLRGKAVSKLVDPKIFEGDYAVVAARCVHYWDTQHKAPGAHLDDELSDILDDKRNRKAPTYRRIITNMARLNEGLNADYVMSKVQTFVRMQQLKQAIVDSAQKLERPGQDLQVEEIEKVWHDILRARKVGFEAGTRLAEYDKLLDYMEHMDEFVTGIEQLDKRYIIPQRGTCMLFLGAAKRGKSWFLVNVGRRNLALRKKVLHITLEMGEPEVQLRYYQSMFSLSKRALHADRKRVRTLDLNDDGDLIGFRSTSVEPTFTLDAPMVREELSARVDHYAGRYDNLFIKRWAPRRLDERILEAYLDQLEASEGFIPDLCILDYIGLWKTEASNHRITLGRAFEAFRGTMVDHNMAGVTAHQLSKAGDEARQAGGGNVAEDWSLIGTADVALVYSSTQWEFEFGLGRILVDRARNEQDRFSLLVTQNYGLGQFALESMLLPSNYWDLVDEAGGGKSSSGNSEGKGGFVPADEEDT